MAARALAVAKDDDHRFSKRPVEEIALQAGLGVLDGAHCGVTVRHRSRVAVDPTQPNLRQVHLIHAELFDELREQGFDVGPAALGENITTRGVDLLALPRGARLRIGASAIVMLTGLRNPCAQIERSCPGLLAAVLDKGPGGELIRKAGVMSIVETGGVVCRGDMISVDLPPPPFVPLRPV